MQEEKRIEEEQSFVLSWMYAWADAEMQLPTPTCALSMISSCKENLTICTVGREVIN